jgi:hypothetical protein
MSNGVGYTAEQYRKLLTLSGYNGGDINALAGRLADKDKEVDGDTKKEYGLKMDEFQAVIGDDKKDLLDSLVNKQSSDEFKRFISPAKADPLARFPAPQGRRAGYNDLNNVLKNGIKLDPRLFSADSQLDRSLQLNQLRVDLEFVKNVVGVNLEVKTLGFKSAKAFAQGLGQVVV